MAPALALSGIVFWLLFLFIAWRAWKLCADRIPSASGGDWPPPWCASIGDGSGSDARDPEHPDPLQIDDIMRWRPAILRWLRSYGVANAEVEDVAQDILESAWKSRANYDPRCLLHTWMWVVTRHHAHTHQTCARVRREVVTESPAACDIVARNPETAAIEVEACRRALTILGRLPDHLGAVFVAVYVERVPVKEYADAIGAVVSTVSGLVCQARHAVARELRRESAVEAHLLARRRRRSLAGRGLRRS